MDANNGPSKSSLPLVEDENPACEVKIMRKAKGEYECVKCHNVFDRYYNGIRHFDRFHVNIDNKKCCDILFHTKGDYYDHREQEHGEIKRYGRQWKDKLLNSTTQQPKCLGKEFAEASTRRENKICPQDTLVDKSHVNMPAGSSNTFNMRVNTAKPTRSRKNKYPRRSWAYIKENEPPENAVMYSMFSQNITKVDNGNVQMYICNMKSKSELQAVLRSINF